ncbi:MAG TPA: DNA alkylation repair protein [Pyrinomonadaceae bacterium]|nr:DNA alkylation repair protein [Acidobacteriota bacterium]HQZ97364.1 DNA alkylation repair protein [Pyrinomonadaceae bacterium]
MTAEEIISELRELADPSRTGVYERYAIRTKELLGISAPEVKAFAKEVKKLVSDRHAVAGELWRSEIYEARAVAYLIDDPKLVTPEQMDAWCCDFDNWATVDGACGYLFCRTPYAYEKAVEWTAREPEFEKRAGFSMMAYLAVHDKKAPDDKLAAFFPLIELHSEDPRNFVKKAVNWALRQIGKRSLTLNGLAVQAAMRTRQQGTTSAKWIAADALRELESAAVLERLRNKDTKNNISKK